MKLLVPTLSALALSPSAIFAQVEVTPAAPWSTDFSKYETKVPWVVSAEDIAARTAKTPSRNWDEAKVGSYTLPDMFALAGGGQVTSAEVWETQRRGELLALFRSEVYGVAPPKPDNLTFRVVETNPQAMEGKATLKRVAIGFKLGGELFEFHLTLFVPNQRAGKAPVFLLLNHRGIENTDPTREKKMEFWPAEYAIARGYAMAAINVAAEVDPDKRDATDGIRQFYKKHYPKPDELTWATLSAWAWSGSRAVDYFETDPDLNAAQVALIGHSRTGKTALWAAAQDTRFALACVNGAGEGGPSLARRNFGETLAQVGYGFPYWFTPKYLTYAGKADTLPIDTHELIALVAPRGYHGGDTTADLGADPRGSWLALVEASKVWALYGKAAPMKPEMPLVNAPFINGPIAYHLITGDHALTLYDWKLYLDHAARIFKPKPAAAHRADPRSAAEIQRANLLLKSFPATNPDLAQDRTDIPAWWQSTLDERDAFLATQVKKGEVINYGTSAGGRPLRAVVYGKARTGHGTTTANGAVSFGDIRSWLGPDHGKRVGLVFSAIHGGEFEGIVGTMNLLAVLETGTDLAGRPQPALAAAAARLDRLIVIPVANPDGRARIPLRMLRFFGMSNRAAEYFNTGAWADGSLIGWPANKEFVPVDFARLQFAGGYFNDAGVNCQHDDFLGQMQPETRALLDLCARERPDLGLNLHTGVAQDNYFMGMLHPVTGRTVEAAWAGLYRQTHTALATAGHRSTTDPAIEADPAKIGPIVPNLDTVINLHAGTLSVIVESPSHSYSGLRRDGTPAPKDPLLLLDAHLVLFTAAFDYLADTGGLAIWAAASKAK